MRRTIELLEHHEEDCNDGVTTSMARLLELCETASEREQEQEENCEDISRMSKEQRAKSLVAKIHMNVHAITPDLKSVVVGRGMYIVGSMLNHRSVAQYEFIRALLHSLGARCSCRPNCVASFVGSTLRVHAIAPIARGGECCISYTELYRPTEERREELREKKYFACTCGRCQAMVRAAEVHTQEAEKVGGPGGVGRGVEGAKEVSGDEGDLNGFKCPRPDCDGAYSPIAFKLLGTPSAARLRSHCSHCRRTLVEHLQVGKSGNGKQKQKQNKKKHSKASGKNGNVDALGGVVGPEIAAELAAEAMAALKGLESRTRTLYAKAKMALEARPRQPIQAKQQQQQHLLQCVQEAETAAALSILVGKVAGGKGFALSLHPRHVLLFELSNLAVNALWQLRDFAKFHVHADRCTSRCSRCCCCCCCLCCLCCCCC
jgi:hypothetical protein